MLLAACGEGDPAAVDPAPSIATTPVPTGSSATPESPAPPATPSPVPALPPGVPTSFDEDVPARDVPSEALIPPGTKPSERWDADTSAGETIVVTYFEPGGDPFVQARGFVQWRRSEDATPAWIPVFGIAHPKREGVLGFQGVTGDATGDGSDDLLLLAATGGSGACGTWRVIDLAAAEQRWSKTLCDAQVDLHADPAGLAINEAVYGPEDPHCCPSAFRTTVLVYRDGGFVKDSVRSTPAA